MLFCRKPTNFRRYNGWTLPLNGMQIFSWTMFFLLFISSTLATIPFPYLPLWPTVNIVIHLWIFFWMVFMTSYNPGNGVKTTPAVFDRQRHIHVIENRYCNICQTKVDEGTKHCRHCNKCIPGFDHHCKWLNNCVGSKNYRYFIILVVSLTILSLVVIVCCSTCIAIFAAQGSPDPRNSTIIKDWRFLNSWQWCILTVATLTCHLIIFGLSAHLLSFHYVLWRKGMTTIAYILEKRRQKTVRPQKCLDLLVDFLFCTQEKLPKLSDYQISLTSFYNYGISTITTMFLYTLIVTRNSGSSNATQQSIQSFSSNPLGSAWARLSSRQGIRNTQRIRDSCQIQLPETSVRHGSQPNSPTISIINGSTVQASRTDQNSHNPSSIVIHPHTKLPPINTNGSRY